MKTLLLTSANAYHASFLAKYAMLLTMSAYPVSKDSTYTIKNVQMFALKLTILNREQAYVRNVKPLV